MLQQLKSSAFLIPLIASLALGACTQTAPPTASPTTGDAPLAPLAPIAPVAEPAVEDRAVWQGIAFRSIVGGETTLGSPESERGRDPDEGVVVVALPHPFWMSETEITQGQWRALMGNNPSYFQSCGDACPVETVSWSEAAALANKLSELEGMQACYDLSSCTGMPGNSQWTCKKVSLKENCGGFRLPLQAEWEHAARAGTRTATYVGDLALAAINESPELDAIAWYAGNSGVEYAGGFDCSGWIETAHPAKTCGPHPVAGLAPNPWGLYDMLGNVYEWMHDELPTQSLSGEEVENPRIIRGGSWAAPGDACRASHYNLDGPSQRTSALGIRLVRNAEGSP